ncbi:ADP-ribosylglycohydrolase [Filimonas lacunae]|uniref:ADP-ribosylglycohydrolase n=1 Tax=Filimonas lacunae TaxID=477680 RepID=A0A173MDE9_9BACT|nr:ADP-ribosylglycohydrolase family protein [Filimonas lacunae]BAV05614.1 ADP-ribosylglycohydrolase [Filimonas lacunae]SIT29191.1 ADP-ribosylglycohydrolase [Filimonas lacunae]
MTTRSWGRDILLGVATGDALGVPVEFLSRNVIARSPVTDMRGYGTHNQPAGTWSDDSSLTFCLAEMLCNGYDLQELANRFVNWKEYAYWTPHGFVFDIGIATAEAITMLGKGGDPLLAGGIDEGSNGNGSLMRILPLLLYVKDKPMAERFACVQQVSSLTHAHIRSVLACFVYIEFARQLMQGMNKSAALLAVREEVMEFVVASNIGNPHEMQWLNSYWLCIGWPEKDISASGYVVKTLQAALWCLFNTNNYKDAVLKAVNLGDDTDTVGAILGGLAGLLYGWESIPERWIAVLARKEEVLQLADRLQNICSTQV